LSLPLEPAYKVISCFQAFAVQFNLYRYIPGAAGDLDPPVTFGDDDDESKNQQSKEFQSGQHGHDGSGSGAAVGWSRMGRVVCRFA
jgi:hypothetical protein